MVHELYCRVVLSSSEGLSLTLDFAVAVKAEGNQVNWTQFLRQTEYTAQFLPTSGDSVE